MFKHKENGASRDRVNRASSACVACPHGSPLTMTKTKPMLNERVTSPVYIISS